MWETTKELLQSLDFWSAVFYLIVGAVVGAVISVWYSLKAQRPRLIVSGSGAGGNKDRYAWRINISNRPSFLGQPIDGEAARDVHAHIRLKDPKSQSHMVFWGHEYESRATIEPGQKRSLVLFGWEANNKGYFVVDGKGEPVARFQDHELQFVLTLRDRLERPTEFRFTVEFDDTHLKRTPTLQLVHPVTLRARLERAREGIRMFVAAFGGR